jgi:hypothetical protein
MVRVLDQSVDTYTYTYDDASRTLGSSKAGLSAFGRKLF